MKGTPRIPFSTLFADTVKTHGVDFAIQHYVRKHRMPAWEFYFWMRSTGLGV